MSTAEPARPRDPADTPSWYSPAGADGSAASGDATAAGAAVEPQAGPGGDEASEPPRTRSQRALSVAIEWLIVLVCALGLALLLRAFLVEVFVIPSGSMEPTLMVDNRVAVYKLGYRLHDVNRGDVVVFDNPGPDTGVDDLIKRIVAVGGETFEIRDAAVYIDGERLEEPYLRAGEATFAKAAIPGCENDADPLVCVVPEDKVLVLGDSREDSRDSRFFGPVDVDDVVGRAFMKIWPPSDIGGL